jgi:hypothetical protein
MFLLKLILALAITVGVLVLVFRVQKQIKGESGPVKASGKEERMGNTELEEFIASYRRDKAVGGTQPTASVSMQQPQASTPQPAVTAPPATAPAGWKSRQTFLSGGTKLGFLVLKAGLPDHHVFAHTRLGEVVEVPQGNTMVNLRIDLLVCNKDLAIVAAVDVPAGPEAETPMEREKEQRLRAAGIRYFRFAPRALPKPGDVRRVIYGE